MPDKKRKSTNQEGERPSKKQQTTSVVTVKHLSNADTAKPILASSPGVTFPSQIHFQAYSKGARAGLSNLLIHSSEHPTIDYTASEGDSAVDNYLKHYVAVFDSTTGELEITEAKRLTVRSAVRTIRQLRDEDEAEIAPVTNYSSKQALTEAFGTKKSKKAVQAMRENRLLGQGDEDLDNPVSAVMLSNIADEDADALASEAAARSNKPLPPANLDTDEISEVYSQSTLIHPAPASMTLQAMSIGPWTARISAKKEIRTRSRFVAGRVGYLTKHLLASPEASDPNMIETLQILRYIEFLLQIHNYVRTLPRKRRIPSLENWPESTFSEGMPMGLVEPIVSHFFPGERTNTTQTMTLLRTTILALTLHIPPPKVNPTRKVLATSTSEISLDMAVESAEIRKLYRELGCKVEAAKDKELEMWGLEKIDKKRRNEDGKVVGGTRTEFAKLSLPLVFPKVGRGKARAK